MHDAIMSEFGDSNMSDSRFGGKVVGAYGINSVNRWLKALNIDPS